MTTHKMIRKDKDAWIGVDLDGTIANDVPGQMYDPLHIGAPIPSMVERIKQHLDDGYQVKILTARASAIGNKGIPQKDIINAIQDWCELHIGKRLEVTAAKDYNMVKFYDDRAIQVIRNTGELVEISRFNDGFVAGVAHATEFRHS